MELFDKREIERTEKHFCDLKCGDVYEDTDGNICICTEIADICGNGKSIGWDNGDWDDYVTKGDELVYPLVASIIIHKYKNKEEEREIKKMSKIKDIIIERESLIIDLIHKMVSYDDDEIWDAWCELGLPYDDEDMDILFDIVTDDKVYEYTINTAEKFLKEIEK